MIGTGSGVGAGSGTADSIPDSIQGPVRERSGTRGADASQAPEVGLARRVLGKYHVTGVFWYRFHQWGMRILPSWAVGPAIVLFTSFFFLSLRRIRQAIAANLEAVLGPCGWWQRQLRIWRTMWNHAWCNSERYERLSTDRPFDVQADGLENWPDSAAMDRGLVLVTAHVGAWDVGSYLPQTTEQRHVHVVREQEMDPEAQEFIETLYRERTAEHFTTHYSRDNPALGAVLLSALRRGEIVGLQGDRAATTGRTADAELLGRPLRLPVGPAALARAADCLAVPVFCFREGRRRYRVAIRPPIEPEPTADQEADLERITRRLTEEISWAIRQRPNQWFCFRELWR